MATSHGIDPRLKSISDLLQKYDRDKHFATLLPPGHPRYKWFDNFQYLFSPKWAPPNGSPPYIAATALLDAYSHLPRRPDLAFMLTWSATNSAYSDLYMHDVPTNSAVLTDSKSIELAARRIASVLNKTVTRPGQNTTPARTLSIEEIIREYVMAAPDKVLHFVGSYILKGFALEHFGTTQHGSTGAPVRALHIPSAYLTFKKNYPQLQSMVAGSFGPKYVGLCLPVETADHTDVSMGISPVAADQSRRLVHALGKELQKLWIGKVLGAPDPGSPFPKDEDWVRFPLQCILYASRNTNVHGNVASRLNSVLSDADSVTSASWMFLSCYLYLALILLCSKKLDATDLAPLLSNVESFG